MPEFKILFTYTSQLSNLNGLILYNTLNFMVTTIQNSIQYLNGKLLENFEHNNEIT